MTACDKSFSIFESTGILLYTPEPNNLRVVIDPGISDFYRALIPKWISVNGQMYPPHISVVRKEIIPNTENWGKYEGQEVVFRYSNIIHSNEVYFWLNVFCTKLEEIRIELGLPVSSVYTRPPDGYNKVFHTTLANKK